MLILRDIWCGFTMEDEDNLPKKEVDVYELCYHYVGYTDRLGFEFKLSKKIYKHVSVPPDLVSKNPSLIDPSLFMTQPGVVEVTTPDMSIYLDRGEVNMLYYTPASFYIQYIHNCNNIYSSTGSGGGAGAN